VSSKTLPPSLSVLLRLMSPKGRNGNQLNLIKMTAEQMTIERQRNETIQDVIDRLLYLPEDKLKEYKHYLNVLVDVYPIDMKIEDGIRIYHVTKRKSK
jgi:hypothetical protein